MSIVRTLDHPKILNFFKFDEGAGTSTSAEQGPVLNDVAITWATANCADLILSDNTAIGGAWQTPTPGSDWALLMLADFVEALPGQLVIGHLTTNHRISIVAGTPGSVTVKGTAGTATFGGGPTLGVGTERCLLTYDADGLIDFWHSAAGVPLMPNGGGVSAATAGDVTTLDAVATIKAFGSRLKFFGLVMVEFPDGLPDDIAAQADRVFEMWEAGNKAHFPLEA